MVQAMIPYTLRQLRYFVGAVESGSVAQASRALNISQPSISAAIKGLEEAFGVQLLIRHHASGVSLTPVGLRFYRHAIELLRHSREFEGNALAENDGLSGQIELGCYVTFAPLFVPRLLGGFREKFPGINVRVRDGVQHVLTEGLTSGAFDLALLYDFGLEPSIDRVVLMPNVVPHAVLPKEHWLATEATVSLRMLASEPLVLLDVPPSGGYFRSLFDELGLTPNVAYSSPSLEMVRGLVGRGLGYSVLATKPASNLTYDGNEVVTVPLSDSLPSSVLVLAWLRQSRLTNPAQAFVRFCEAVLAAGPEESADRPAQ
jgi:DNA-binding transcriptional LysR family regulator